MVEQERGEWDGEWNKDKMYLFNGGLGQQYNAEWVCWTGWGKLAGSRGRVNSRTK